jgi:hypothetical protein
MSIPKQIAKKTFAKIPTQGNDVTTLGTNSVATTNIQDLAVTTNKLADASVTSDKIEDTAVQYILKHDKNYIINGDMRIAQRGTSFAAAAINTYTVDRFTYVKVSTGAVHTVTQDTDVPTLAQANYLFTNSLKVNLTTPDTSIGPAEWVGIGQRMEGYNWANIAQKTFTLSFWVKATLPGIYCIAVGSSTGDKAYTAEYTINTTNTWEYKTITVSASPSAGTWDYSNGIGLYVFWILAAGSGVQGTAGSWQTNGPIATANQVNGVNTGATNFAITGVMLNEGSVAAPFRTFSNGSFANELRTCQRYFASSANIGTTVPSANGTNAFLPFSGNAFNAGNTQSSIFMFPAEVRAINGTLTYYDLAASPASGKVRWADGTGTQNDNISGATTDLNTKGWWFGAGGIGATGAGSGKLQYKYDCEL